MSADKKFMERCLQLARCGEGNVSPNPMVGAVLVCDGKIIGEGYHRRYGEAHAEVNAVRSVKDESLLRRSTLYVSLEPCSHYGKTPPCAELIIRKQIPRVVIACLDPFPQVAGRGVKMLEAAGIEVTVGLLEKEALALNERFFWFHQHRSPYIIAKWAQSADGYMDRCRMDCTEPPCMFSSPSTLRRVHKLRAEADAILVGARTALLDNPSLTARYWEGRSPVRLLLDREFEVPRTARLYDGTVPTYVFTEKEAAPAAGVQFVSLTSGGNAVQEIKEFLYKHNIQTLMVEGGAMTLRSFFLEGVNEARVEYGNQWLGGGVEAPKLLSPPVQTLTDGSSTIRFFKGYPLKMDERIIWR